MLRNTKKSVDRSDCEESSCTQPSLQSQKYDFLEIAPVIHDVLTLVGHDLCLNGFNI